MPDREALEHVAMGAALQLGLPRGGGMATKVLEGSSWTQRDRPVEAMPPENGTRRGAPQKRALELVAMRGRDVIGVRHLLEGTQASLGRGPDALAPISVGSVA